MRTNVTRWDAFREMEDFFRRFRPWVAADEPMSEWRPDANISKLDNEYLIKADLPEVKKEDVKIALQNGVLTITGERKLEKQARARIGFASKATMAVSSAASSCRTTSTRKASRLRRETACCVCICRARRAHLPPRRFQFKFSKPSISIENAATARVRGALRARPDVVTAGPGARHVTHPADDHAASSDQ